MAWESNVDAATKKNILQQKTATPQPILDPNVSTNLTNIKQRAGWVPIETQMALAKAGASNQAIDAVGVMAAKKIIDTQAEPESSSIMGKTYDGIKTVSRWLTAALDFVPELTQGAVSQAAEIAGEYGIGSYGQGTDRINNVDGWFISTKLGSMIKSAQGDYDPVTGERITAGTGFFTSDELLKRQGERSRRYRGTINGSAFTVGRAAANSIFTEKTVPYNIFSGVIDGLLLIKTDPTTAITKTVKGVRDVRTLVPRLTKADAAVLREAVTFDAGFIPGLSTVGLDETKYAKFMEQNWRARKLVSNLRKETNVVKIMDMFDQSPNISNEMLGLLAKSTTDDQVKAVLALGFQIDKGALPDTIRTLQAGRISSGLKSVGGVIMERTPLGNSKFVARNSRTVTRYLTEKPDESLLVSGDRFQNSKAVKTIVNYLRTIGADEDTVSRIGLQAVESFTDMATQADQYKTLKVFEQAMDETLRLKGVSKEIRDDVFRQGREGLDQLRIYMTDRVGVATDNGLAKWLANTNREYMPADEIETLIKTFGEGTDFQIISPLQISELLKRVQVLPDVRELRRLTSNRFFGFGEFVGSGAGKSSVRDVTKIIDEDLYDDLNKKLGVLRKQVIGSTNEPQNKDLYEEIKRLQLEQNSLKQIVRMRVRTGEERAAFKAIDLLQTQIWKPLTLMTGGYVVRNSLDAQVRMAFSGLPSAFTHPIEYMQLVLGTTKRSTLKGELLEGLKLEQYVDDVREAMTFGLRQQGLGNQDIYDHMIKTGAWARVDRSQVNGVKLHTDAVAQNGVLVHSDPLQKIAAQTFVEFGGVTTESRLVAKERILGAMKSDSEIYNTVKQNYASGLEVSSSDGVHSFLPPIFFEDLSPEDLNLQLLKHAELVPVSNVQVLTGNVSDIEFAYAFNRIPLRDADGNLENLIRTPMADVIPIEVEPIRVGTTVLTSSDPNEPTYGVIARLINPDTGERFTNIYSQNIDNFVAEIQPIVSEKVKGGTKFVEAFGTNSLGTKQFRKVVLQTQIWDGQKGLPLVLKREMLSTERNTNTWRKSMDRSTDFFFGKLYGSVTRKLERSPVFRNYYYQEVGKYVDELSPEGAQNALDAIKTAADDAKQTVADYVGDKKLLTGLDKALTGKGTATLEELDDYAKHIGLQKTKELLYDASNRSNLEDSVRIIAPFATAWREIIGTYVHIFNESKLAAYRNTTRVYRGATEADPENDGRGFFFNDPVTNVMSFMFPASGTLAKLITGLDAPLKAPVARLSQGLQVFPALGPFVQLLASKLIPDTPRTDKIVSFLLPYGRKDFSSTAGSVIPNWVQKLSQAVTQNEGKMDTVYANTYVETLRALSASGNYDLSDPDQTRQLESDAKGKASWLTAFRALSQFLGPTAGSTEFKISTKDGDMYVGELIKQFYALQTKDYDTAVSTFLEQFGDDVSLYVSSKSRSTVEGLEATEQFGDWERNNEGLLKEFPDVASYLAPAGDDFSFSVWDRQIRSGSRVRLTDKELIDLAQQRIGSSKYRWARKQVGQFPNENSRALLKQYRAVLHDELPGFPLVAEFKVGEYENQIEDMTNLVNDPRVANNPIAQTIKTYLTLRDYAKQTAFQQFGSADIKQSKQTQYLRDKLASMGEMLILENSEFGRVWQRFLSYEVED